ncbi:MAG: carbohydrate-binding domain-containing protein [Candidatus Fimadaptatus sp.]
MKQIKPRRMAGLMVLAWALALPAAAPYALATADAYPRIAVEYKAKDTGSDWSADECAPIALSDGGSTCSGGATATADGVTITAGGDYLVSGVLSDGCITIEAGEQDDVRLILSGASISAQDGPAINCQSADKLIITLAEGTENSLSDGQTYSAQEDEEPNAALYSRADLSINGSGALTVTGNYLHGILSKDDLKITGGSITVSAAGDALRGRDGVAICGGTLDLSAQDDGIQSSYEGDASRGWVVIEGGDIAISAAGDGIAAESVAQISGGTVTITSGEGAAAAAVSQTDAITQPYMAGKERPDTPSDMSEAPADMPAPPDGEAPADMPALPEGEAPADLPEGSLPARGTGRQGDKGMDGFGGRGGMMPGQTATVADGESAKGIKSSGALYIDGGTLVLDCADDALHAADTLEVTGGDIAIASGDDALHSDDALTISDGSIAISTCYEGLEGAQIAISGGLISVVSTDDGVNAAGGVDSSGMSGAWGRDQFAAGSQELRISGGTLYVNASGDGIDSNGSVYMSGGTVLISGPTNSGNGALDYGGTWEQTGGVLVAAGAMGMAQSVSSSSSQAAIMVAYGSAQAAGARLTLTDAAGGVVASFAPAKQYECAVISAPGIAVGSEYLLWTGGEAQDGAQGDALSGGEQLCGIQVSDILTSVGSDGSAYSYSGGMMRGGRGK